MLNENISVSEEVGFAAEEASFSLTGLLNDVFVRKLLHKKHE